jgi:hypothetical protein
LEMGLANGWGRELRGSARRWRRQRRHTMYDLSLTRCQGVCKVG